MGSVLWAELFPVCGWSAIRPRFPLRQDHTTRTSHQYHVGQSWYYTRITIRSHTMKRTSGAAVCRRGKSVKAGLRPCHTSFAWGPMALITLRQLLRCRPSVQLFRHPRMRAARSQLIEFPADREESDREEKTVDDVARAENGPKGFTDDAQGTSHDTQIGNALRKDTFEHNERDD
jgi:hypothetical protein